MQKLLTQVWHFFTSMKTALILLGLTILVSIMGTLISPYVYDSIGFKTLFCLLGINLTACTINRFHITRKRAFHPQIPSSAGKVPSKISSSLADVSKDSQPLVEQVLKSHGYWAKFMVNDDGWALVAVKRRWGYWGSSLVHIAFVIIIIGVMLGSFGFSGSIMAMSGDTINFEAISTTKGSIEKNYSVKINSIEDRFLPNGKRDNWYTNISIMEGNKELASGNVSVNHPFKYDGVSYYQKTYADYAEVIIEKDQVIFKGLIPIGLAADENKANHVLHNRIEQRVPDSDILVRGVKLQGKPVLYLQMFTAEQKEPLWLKLTAQQNKIVVNDYKITLLQLTNSTGIQIKSDPGIPLVALGCGILLLGFTMAFYWRPSQISGLYASQTGTLLLGMSNGKLLRQNDAEFNSIVERITMTAI